MRLGTWTLEAPGLMAAITCYKDTCKRQKWPILPVSHITVSEMLHVGMVCQVEIARKIRESDLFPLLHTQGSQLCFFVPALFKAWKERDFFFFLKQINKVRSAMLAHGLIHGQFWLHSCSSLSLSLFLEVAPFLRSYRQLVEVTLSAVQT